jgi:hypothetical protein
MKTFEKVSWFILFASIIYFIGHIIYAFSNGRLP